MSDSLSRRQFVRDGLALVGLTTTVPAFLARTAWAVDAASLAAGSDAADGRVLVVIHLAGGNDGLNTVVPYRQDPYYRARPRLAVKPDEVLRLNDEIGFHPAAGELKKLYDDGLLAVVQGVGYPNPNRSHFVSTDIWETADPQQRVHTGWIGRYFDSECQGSDPPDPQTAIGITQEIPLALVGESFTPIAVQDPDRLKWRAHPTNREAERVFEQLIRPRQDDHTPDGKPIELTTLDYLRRTAADSREAGQALRDAASDARVNNRRSFGAQLELVVTMLASNLPTRVFYLSLGGFDTHANQAGRHQRLLAELGRGLSSFTAKLKERGLLDRVVVLTFSEFGRRVAENASGGTDHGVAAPLFVIGGRIHPGVHGLHPSREQLDNGDLIHTTDFRAVYADILENWLGGRAGNILCGANGQRLNLIKL